MKVSFGDGIKQKGSFVLLYNECENRYIVHGLAWRLPEKGGSWSKWDLGTSQIRYRNKYQTLGGAAKGKAWKKNRFFEVKNIKSSDVSVNARTKKQYERRP